MKNVPFFANLPDDLYCFEASIRMILKYFQPEKEYSWEEIRKITGKKEGLWTWPQHAMVELLARGFDVINVEDFDFRAFIKNPQEFLKLQYGEDGAREQVAHSDIEAEKRYAQELLQHGKQEMRIPDFSDIRSFLGKGFLVVCLINAKALNGQEGYVGHFVVVFACNDEMIAFHDPGLPPTPNRTVVLKDSKKAWAYPTEKAKGIIAIKYGRRG